VKGKAKTKLTAELNPSMWAARLLCWCAVGPLTIDKEVYSQLMATGQFEQMNLEIDEVGGPCCVTLLFVGF
jgi:hypothetical protein